MSKDIEKLFKGTWRITRMDTWAQDAVDLVVPGYISFGSDNDEMRFIAVKAWLDVYYSSKGELPTAEFSWQGIDERDERCGRGWAAIQPDGTLAGHFFFHMGDESGFVAKRQ